MLHIWSDVWSGREMMRVQTVHQYIFGPLSYIFSLFQISNYVRYSRYSRFKLFVFEMFEYEI